MARRVSSQRFVGRVSEIAVLTDALEASGRGETATVLVGGEAGVGKTRLVGELGRVARERGARLLTGGCVAVGEGGLPYGPVTAALHDLVAGLDPSTLETLVGPAASDLARIMPGLDAHLTSALGSPIPPEWMKARLFDAVMGLLQRLGETSPAVLVFEDLHWADPASLDLIGFLVRSPRRGGMLSVVTYRSDELHQRHPLLPWLAEIDRVAGVERIDLERLTRPETAEQIAAILATEPSEALVDSIHRRSGGNPFFAEELIAADERGLSRRLSSSLREILLGRLAGLGKDARAVVDVASVAGQPIHVDTLAVVAGLPEAVVQAGIGGALDAQILASTDNDDERIGFRHALMQEAAYGDLLPGERRRLHLAFAAMLEGEGEPDEARKAAWWAERAHHARAANDLAGALVTAVGAGHAAEHAAAFKDELRYFDQALGLWEAVPDPGTLVREDRADLLRLAAEAARFAGDSERSVVLLRAALDALDPGSVPERRASLLVALGSATSQVGLRGGRRGDASCERPARGRPSLADPRPGAREPRAGALRDPAVGRVPRSLRVGD